LKNILHVVGNRPQFIKLAVLYKEIAASKTFDQKIIHTGQHSTSEMSGIFFSEFQIPAVDLQLNVRNDGYPDSFIAQVSVQLQDYFSSQKDCLVFVYGDTNTTLAATMAATRTNVQCFHFEAGIRTGDKSMPEEINRVLTDRMAFTNYCCTTENYQTMMAEGYGSAINNRVVLSGDLMYDAFLQHTGTVRQPEGTGFVLATIHRALNILLPSNLKQIIDALNKIHKQVPVIMPAHPHTQKRIREFGLTAEFNFQEPVGYSDMQKLLASCSYVITDSGGLAREAFFSKKRSLVIMEKPFWPEIVAANGSINTSPNELSILDAFGKLSLLQPDFLKPIFGNGRAAKIIHQDLMQFYN
jgi:UDP-GlcNAc3NAcA epimerase